MNNKASRLVSIERAMEIMDCYGADPQAWPEDERVATQSLVKASSELQQHQEQTRQLDDALNPARDTIQSGQPGDHKALSARIIAQLPQQETATSGPASTARTDIPPKHLWQRSGMIAAGIMLALVGYLLVQPQNGPQQPAEILARPVMEQPILDQWLWDEVLENEEFDDDEELGFMAMIEFEL